MIGGFLRVAWHVMREDLTVEVRSLEIVARTLLFAITVVLMCSFGLVKDGRPVDDVAPAILWISIAFSGTLALGRTFERERHNDTLRALMLAPADRPALYVGKLAGILLLLGLVEIVLVPLVGLFFNAPVFAQAVPLSLLLVTGTLGFCSVGTLFAAMLVRARSRDVLLPVLLYPITVPVIIAGVRATAELLEPDVELALVRFWVALLVALDVVFVTLALWTFEPLMTD